MKEKVDKAQPAYVLSPCGISLFLKQTEGERKNLVNRYSNAKSDSVVDADDSRALIELIAEAEACFLSSGVEAASKLSAELNSLVKYYEGNLHDRHNDYHCLLATDTWLGEEAAKLVEKWLRSHGFPLVEVKRQPDLQTRDLDAFQSSLSDLVKWSEATLPGFQEKGYRVVFNLTGGFKSVQGFLQTLAMFYADEVVYIFEATPELMRIPRLPVRLSAEEMIRKRIGFFRRLALGLTAPAAEDVSETLLMQSEGQICLSPWGELVWQRARKQLYEERLWPSPYEKITFGEKFAASVDGLQSDRLRRINEMIDDFVKYLRTGKNPSSLSFKQLEGNPSPPSTHEMYAWSDQDARRIFGHFDNDRFVLDRLGKHL